MTRPRRAAGLAIAALAVAWAPAVAEAPAALAGARAVELRSGSGATLRGWFAPGHPGAGAVLLLHGVGGSAADMCDRARFLAAAGRAVLLVDFRGHGASTPARTTWGALESRDVGAALAFLRGAAPNERIGVVGVSMGGAAALLGPAPLPVQAIVLESVYPTIDDAVRDRLRTWLGPLGRAIRESVMAWLLPRDGVTAADLRPIDRIGEQTAPVLLLAGTEDRYTPIDESRALFARARAPKELWEVEGASHEDLHAFATAEYERRVGGFLARHLDVPALASGGPGHRAPALGAEPEEHAQRAGPLDDGAQRARHGE